MTVVRCHFDRREKSHAPDKYVTDIGPLLRKTGLDELPQLISILKGDMSFVGPRPALFNQDDLLGLRTSKDIHRLVPGLTGWAQINGRDELPIPVKVEFDEYYLKNRSFLLDLKIITQTAHFPSPPNSFARVPSSWDIHDKHCQGGNGDFSGPVFAVLCSA